jgi:hypothetical protein
VRLIDFFLKLRKNAFLIGLLSLLWFILRTGTKPSRAVYPCQRAAAANSYLWLTVYVLPFLSLASKKVSAIFNRKVLTIISLAAIITSVAFWGLYEMFGRMSIQEEMNLVLSEMRATSQPASDIYVVRGTKGNDDGVLRLINLMGREGLLFYKSPEKGTTKGPDGIIAKDDVIIIKVNSQWDERGGTNTDLLKIRYPSHNRTSRRLHR